MISARYPQITDELLSAYIDQAVTEEERLLIETAVADEPTVAWRLETLQQTVQLLRALPEMVLTRSFTLHELPVAAGHEETARGPATALRQPRTSAMRLSAQWAALRETLAGLWQMGSPLLRNAAAASFALFLVLLVGDIAVTGPSRLARATVATAVLTQPAATSAMTPRQQASLATPTASSPTLAPPTLAEQANKQAQNPATASQSASPQGVGGATTGSAAAEAATGPGTSEVNQGNRAPGPDETMSTMRGESADHTEPMVAESMANVIRTQKTTTTIAAYSGTTTTAAETGAAGQLTTSVASATANGAAALETAVTTEAAAGAAKTAATAEGGATPLTTPTPAPATTLTAPFRNGGAPAVPWFSTLLVAQVITGFLTLLFAALWWRSRATTVDA